MDIKDIKKAKQGNKESLSKLFLEIAEDLYRVAFAILNNEDDSKDVISSTIIIVYEHIGELKEPKYFKTWVTRILINECKSLISKNKRNTSLNIEDYDIGQEDTYQLLIDDLLKDLEEDHKEIILLYYVEDMSVKEIANSLKISEGTVKSRLSRAREKIRQMNVL